MLQTPALSESIENLYRAFQPYELRPHTDACPCCHTEGADLGLHRKPLRKLSTSDLRDYAMDAIYTWGTGDDFKHFISRIFELLVSRQERHDFVDAAAVFRKLMYESWCSNSWRTWPTAEQAAISNYFHAVWNAALNSNPEELPFDGVHGWIQAIAQAENDLGSYLDHWLKSDSINAHRNLALMITEEGFPRAGRPSGGYWEDRREQWIQLNDWLRMPEVRQKLANAVERWSEMPFGGEFFDAASVLP